MIDLNDLEMADLNSLVVLGMNFLSDVFIFDHIFSMGEKSGEYPGKYSNVAPVLSIATLTRSIL